MNKKQILIFLLILFLAIFLRFYKINQIPPSLNWDEVSIGYNAYSVLKTGKDEWGQLLPLSFKAYGDYKLPVYIYLDVPFIGFFGLNEFGTRLPSILAGTGIVVLIFLIIRHLTKSVLLSLIGMFIISVTPWLIITSRIALEANLALFLITLSFYFLLLSFSKKYCLFLSSLFIGLSAFTYNSSRVIIIPLLILVLIFFRKSIKSSRKEIIASVILLFTFLITTFWLSLFVDSGSRYTWTTILDEGAINHINEMRNTSNLPPLLTNVIYNRVTSFITIASQNYIKHFDQNFLFISGGSNYQFSVPGSGLLYLVMLPLILLGIMQVLIKKKNWQLFILAWIIISPIPGAITRDAPHALRVLFMTIPMILITTLGVMLIKDSLRQKIFIPILLLILVILTANTYLFWQNYSKDYIQNYSWSWQYGYKEAVDYIKENGQKYDQIVITKKYGEPHEFLLFFLKIDPNLYQTDKNLIRYEKSDWFWVDAFNKFRFINDWEIKEKTAGLQNVLLITDRGNYPEGAKILKTINFLNGNKAFDIVAIN